jgi:hypothetical protein
MWAINRLLENRWAILTSALVSSALILAGTLSVALASWDLLSFGPQY